MPKPQPWYASLNQPPRSPKDGRNRRAAAPTHNRSIDRTNSGVDPGSQATFTYTIYTTIFPAFFPQPPAIPYAGVRAGELIGYRAWLVLSDHSLCSLAHHFVWEPGAVIEGDVDKVVNNLNWFITPLIFGGTYSYKDPIYLREEFGEITDGLFPYLTYIGMHTYSTHGLAFGTIKCWGEVIEHEKGYRAQFAKLHTIDHVIGHHLNLHSLRERYKV